MAPPPDLDRLLAQIQFPGMPAPESDVARIWLGFRGHLYDRIEFNVRLGDGTDPGDGYTETTRRQAVLLTQKRADVIAWLDGRATIAEVKIRAGLGAIGQLLGYQHLYAATHPDEPLPFLQVIARRADSDVRGALSSLGIELLLYEPAPSLETAQ